VSDETTRREDLAVRLRAALAELESVKKERDEFQRELIQVREKKERIGAAVKAMVPDIANLQHLVPDFVRLRELVD
jgi:uncharacterized coiled-coil DUF342 family protein